MKISSSERQNILQEGGTKRPTMWPGVPGTFRKELRAAPLAHAAAVLVLRVVLEVVRWQADVASHPAERAGEIRKHFSRIDDQNLSGGQRGEHRTQDGKREICLLRIIKCSAHFGTRENGDSHMPQARVEFMDERLVTIPPTPENAVPSKATGNAAPNRRRFGYLYVGK